MKFSTCLLLSAAALIPFHSASAQEEAGEHREPADDFHGEIVVAAPGLERLDLLAGTSVIAGEELQRNLDGQIGEVLSKLPGVSASGFAPGVSRPILRGFGGERVRVLTDGVGAIDASSASDDHAVTVEPLITHKVEVLRGPAVLLYGSQAIGGAVNVITKRIPPAVPDEAFHIDALASVDSASNRREGGLSVDVPLGTSVAFHVDGSYRKTDNLEIPGFAASEGLRADLLAQADEEEEEGHLEEAEELREGANTEGELPNSWTETYTLGTGIAFFSGESNFGVSFDYYDTNYGIPGLPGLGHVHEHEEGEEEDHEDEDHGDEDHEDEHEEGDVSIGMQRYRVDLRGTLDLGDGFFDRIQTRWGYSDYTHTEFEGDEIGTVFDVEGVEGRVELVQSNRNGWQGSIGAQFAHTDFSALGAEAFIPSNKTDSYAVFALQEVDLDLFELELGGRYEHTDVDAMQSLGIARDFDTFSGAAGLSYALTDQFRLGINGSRAERAPSAQELFADGPHVATQQYEIGNPALGKEGSWGLEGFLRGALGPATISASIYHNWFDDFIYLSETGVEEDGLEVFEFLQQDAKQFGLEGQITVPVYRTEGFTLLTDLRGDYTRATLSDGSPVPRIPPLSLLGALEGKFGDFDARAEVQWFGEQTRVSEHETPTEDFAFVNLSLAWHPLTGEENFTLMLQADNVFDAEGRRHSSFTKDFVPLAGRNFKLSARASF